MKDFKLYRCIGDELVTLSLGNMAYSLNKVNKLAQNIVERLKDRFCQWLVTFVEGSQ